MAHAKPPDIAPRTGLWGLGFRMEVIASNFYNLYQDILGAWIVGKWFAWPFYFMSLYFNIARDKCWEADQDLVFAISWVKGITEGSTLIDILEVLWYEFRYLRADPVGWVRAKIDQVSVELSFLRQDPYGWMRSRLYLALPVFYSLLGNSGWWIYSKLDERYPEIGEFIRDSWGFIYNKVLSLFSWARELNSNPTNAVIQWVHNRTGWFWSFVNDPTGFIVNRLKHYNYEIYNLLTYPKNWFKVKLAERLGMDHTELDTFIPSLIRRAFGSVLSNEGGMLEYVQEAMVNLILRFI